MNIETVREFFGWCLAINAGILVLSSILVFSCRNSLSRIHAKISGVDEESVRRAYFSYMANFKIAVIVFNLAPYLALRMMA